VAAVFLWAQGQSLAAGTAAIVLMGVGMAAPHALLGAFPKLVDRLPRPGRWMELLKQSMGFVLLPVAVWLLGTLRREYIPWAVAYAVVLVFCLWMWGSWVRFDAPLGKRLLVKGIAVVLAVGAGVWMLTPPEPPAAPERSFAEQIADARREGNTVVVKFTADWCLECIVVERRVYRDDEVKRRLAADDVVYKIGDVTERWMPAARLIGELRGAPPLTVVYPPRGEPIFLPGGIDAADLLDALGKARQAG
jgi:thiol:disulfide interchange protein DsbD